MATVRLRNTNPLGDVVVPLLRRVEDHPLKAGEVFEVEAELAARLLEQVGNYELVADEPAKSTKRPAPTADPVNPQEG